MLLATVFAFRVVEVLYIDTDSFGKNLTLDLFAHNYAHSMLCDIVDLTSLGMVAPMESSQRAQVPFQMFGQREPFLAGLVDISAPSKCPSPWPPFSSSRFPLHTARNCLCS